ncbi:TetR/AcrR family transcriptional regulator [Piscinibacter sp.]|uniref:TetR/AcrR family transcriptional regulator n=1 Tax=Piscinibacter sp. TaxID=1903157 RepID=UPI002BFEB0A4|nr:TetR/AcrR family transcriptional regulator [Albitalea sp.]HUG26043.1 TetR/AcrR family transcriptional regulator [Albitalea sp.]
MATPNSTPDVRTQILEAAWRLIGEHQDASVPLLEIARAAGVSRQTVYVHFGSRAGLLLAMVEHRDATSPELARLRRVRQELPPVEALEATVRAWFKYVPVVFNVAHALQAAAATDADARQAWESRMRLLRGGLLGVMQRLHADGHLARGWTPETATDWCYHLVHIDSWQHLVVERRWKPADVAQRTVATLQAALLRPSVHAK